MPEDQDLAGLADDPEASSDDPTATDEEDIESIKAQYEKRIRGLQSSHGKRESALERRLDDLSSQLESFRESSMSEEERATYATKRERDELEHLRTQAALWDLADEYPDVVPLLRKFGTAKTLAEQAKILSEALNPKKGRAAPEPDDVDRNNPVRKPVTSPGGDIRSEDEADRILAKYSRMPGR